MVSTYRTYLQMKNILKDLQKDFFDKLNDNEKERMNEIFEVAESLKPNQASKFKRKSVSSGNIQFQPRNIIFCLSLKKIFTKKKLKYIRYSFAVIRCLFKDYKRSQQQKSKTNISRKIIPAQKDINFTSTNGNISSVNPNSSIEDKFFQKICNFIIKKRNNSVKYKIFAAWKARNNKLITNKKIFLAKIKEMLRKRFIKSVLSIYKFTKNNKIAISLLQSSLTIAINKRKNSLLLNLFLGKGGEMKNKPNLHIQSCEFIPKYNIKEYALSENQKMSYYTSDTKETSIISYEIDTENFEDFSPAAKINTKMVKKKKILLRSRPAVSKIEILHKNHLWVEGLALVR